MLHGRGKEQDLGSLTGVTEMLDRKGGRGLDVVLDLLIVLFA